jgi:C4-dicarboxylate-specific signal transduction histidine kinase
MEYEYRYVRPDGSLRHLQTLGHPVRDERGELVEYVGTILDITERRQAEEALQRTQAELAHVTRVMTMGEIAASIAHEVNQPLAAVVMSANACRRWLAADPPNIAEAGEAIQRIISDGNRASQVVGRIRALLQKTAPQQMPLNVNELIQETLMLTRSELARHQVTIHTALHDDLPHALGDRIQLQQVLVNLILNGADAMSAIADRPRLLTVRSQRCDGGVLVDVQDTGVGLFAEEPDRIFQAFFSTKPHGLGMGLSISRSIVEAHGGRLWATPNVDGRPGATLHFTLPPHGGS